MGEDDEVEVGGANGGRVEDIYGEDEVCKQDSGRDKSGRDNKERDSAAVVSGLEWERG